MFIIVLFCLSLQLITIILATVLFVKYIFFDKSETYTTSVPPTPALSNSQQPALSCPFDLSDISEFSLVRRRRGSVLSVGIPEHGSGWRNMEIERLRQLLEQETPGMCANGGIPHPSAATSGQDGSSNSSQLALPTSQTLPNSTSTGDTKPSSESLSSLLRAPSSGSLKDLSSVAVTSKELPTPEQPLTLPLGHASTGTQTDLAFRENGPMFEIGDGRTSPPETTMEPAPQHEASPQPPPRPLEECLMLFKSEVGVYWIIMSCLGKKC